MSERTRATLRRANQRLHMDLCREREENARLRRALDLVADEVEETSRRFFLIVTKGALHEMSDRIRAMRRRWW